MNLGVHDYLPQPVNQAWIDEYTSLSSELFAIAMGKQQELIEILANHKEELESHKEKLNKPSINRKNIQVRIQFTQKDIDETTTNID